MRGRPAGGRAAFCMQKEGDFGLVRAAVVARGNAASKRTSRRGRGVVVLCVVSRACCIVTACARRLGREGRHRGRRKVGKEEARARVCVCVCGGRKDGSQKERTIV